MSKTPRIVKSLKITEVSAVYRAANPHARVLLRKSDDDDTVEVAKKRQNQILIEEANTMNKSDDADWLDWLNSVSPALRRKLRELIAVADAIERETQVAESTPREAVAGNYGQGELTPQETRLYGKRDSLRKIAADCGLVPLCKHLIESGSSAFNENQFAECVQDYATKKGIPVTKLWSSDTAESQIICKAASVCRAAEYSREAEQTLGKARVLARAAQLNLA